MLILVMMILIDAILYSDNLISDADIVHFNNRQGKYDIDADINYFNMPLLI